jgi:DNA-binding response OmpR family regulator
MTAPRRRVLVVEDEPSIGEIVGRYLERAGYDTRVVHDGPAAVAAHAEVAADILVLDVMLPGFDGLEVMRRIGQDPRAPRPGVILVTARGEQQDRIEGLARGADDYVVKPYFPAELVARVDAVLRRLPSAAADEPPFAFGEIEIDPGGRRVRRAGADVPLTSRELDLLLFLARRPGRAFSRDELMQRVWGHAFYTDTSTVTVHVRRLRTKLERDPDRPALIETVRGVGYRLAAT